MLKPLALPTLCLAMLAVATPAYGESAGPDSRHGDRAEARLRFVPQMGGGNFVGPAPTPETNLFAGSRPGLGISRQTYRQEDGSEAVRQGLVGSLPLTQGISADLGLFAVTHEDQKEPEFRRSWSAKNVGPRNRKVAAVGLNVRF
jgi:hypothetical protein